MSSPPRPDPNPAETIHYPTRCTLRYELVPDHGHITQRLGDAAAVARFLDQARLRYVAADVFADGSLIEIGRATASEPGGLLELLGEAMDIINGCVYEFFHPNPTPGGPQDRLNVRIGALEDKVAPLLEVRP